MPTGTLGTPTLLPASRVVALYKVPVGKPGAIININLCNISQGAVLVRLAISAKDAPDPSDWIEYDAYLNIAGTADNDNVLERSGIAISGGETVFAYANVANAVSARTFGVEK